MRAWRALGLIIMDGDPRKGISGNELDELLDACVRIIARGRAIILENWRKPHTVRHKGAIDLVTETDLAVQELLHRELEKLLPEAAFLGEEGESDPRVLASEFCWVADPVDGTTNFVHRLPMVAISLALCRYGKPVLGIVDIPALGECFRGRLGGGSFLNDAPIQVSEAANLEESLVATGFPYDFGDNLEAILARLREVLPKTQGLRRFGSAATDLAYVACGRLDAFYEAGLKPWDMAAGWLLVEEAGGRTSDFAGAPLALGSTLLATNGLNHAAMLALLGADPHW